MVIRLARAVCVLVLLHPWLPRSQAQQGPAPRPLPIAQVSAAERPQLGSPQPRSLSGVPVAPPAGSLVETHSYLTSASAQPGSSDDLKTTVIAEDDAVVTVGGPPSRRPGGRLSGAYSVGEDLAYSQATVGMSITLPLDPPRRMLIIAPSADFTFLDADGFVDTPDELYRLSVAFLWMEQLNDRWRLQFMLSPLTQGDADSLGEYWRFMGMALAHWNCTDRLRFTAGVVALGREDIPFVPALGFLWTPTDDWEINAMLPIPRVARRLWVDETGKAAWIYAAGGLGGGTWNVERANGAADELNLTEFRCVLGGEVVRGRDKRLFVEAGVGFGRELEYEAGGEINSYSPGLFLQAGWNF